MAAVGALLGMAAPTHAPGSWRTPTISFTTSTKLEGGREFAVYASTEKGRDGRIAVGIADDITRGYMASDFSSLAKGRVDNRRVDAPIGRAGAMDMRFQPTGPTEESGGRCLRIEERPGVLSGSLSVRLRSGGLEVEKSRLEATRTRFEIERCGAVPLPARSHQNGGTRAVLTGCGRNFSAYQVARYGNGRTEVFAVGPYGTTQGLFSLSYGIRRTRPGAFTYAGDFSTATLRLPPPFAGIGEYADGRVTGDPTWVPPSGETLSMRSREATLNRNGRNTCAAFARASSAPSPTATLRAGAPAAIAPLP